MKPGPLGIYYLSYSATVYPRSARKLIIGYTRKEFLDAIAEKEVPVDYICWMEECRTPGLLLQGNIEQIKEWIYKNIPLVFQGPLE